MSQKVTIHCDNCGDDESYEGEKLIVLIWQKDVIGILSHDVDDKDIIEASKKLIKDLPRLTADPNSKN
jgi:hypothetical protein